jgi:hypothetical protein
MATVSVEHLLHRGDSDSTDSHSGKGEQTCFEGHFDGTLRVWKTPLPRSFPDQTEPGTERPHSDRSITRPTLGYFRVAWSSCSTALLGIS